MIYYRLEKWEYADKSSPFKHDPHDHEVLFYEDLIANDFKVIAVSSTQIYINRPYGSLTVSW